MSASSGFTPAMLLDSLADNQQRMVELIAQAFVANSWTWPVFDYVEAQLEIDGIDAWTELEKLPQHQGSGYAAAWWSRAGGAKPAAHEPVGLTVVGLHHAEEGLGGVRKGLVPVFFALLKLLAEWRRRLPLSPTEPRKLEISSDDVIPELSARGVSTDLLAPTLLKSLLDNEPAAWGSSGGSTPDGGWTRGVSRNVYRFEHVETIEAYVEEIIAMFPSLAPRPQMAVPSPLGLVAAVDYLDTVWRLVPDHKDHLFRLHGAQRTALLAFPAETADEFDSRLSGLGELLRSVQLPDRMSASRKERDKPLAGLETYLKSLLPESRSRIEGAIETLHNVLHVRDASQHTAAGRKGAAALGALGVGYPPPSWSYGWIVVQARTIEALDALREELATLAP